MRTLDANDEARLGEVFINEADGLVYQVMLESVGKGCCDGCQINNQSSGCLTAPRCEGLIFTKVEGVTKVKLSTQHMTLQELRDAGYAVCIFSPEELGDVEPKRIESRMCECGTDAIACLKEVTV